MNASSLLFGTSLLLVAMLARAEGQAGVDEADTPQLPQTVDGPTVPVTERDAPVFSPVPDRQAESLPTAPELREGLTDQSESFDQERQTGDETFDQ